MNEEALSSVRRNMYQWLAWFMTETCYIEAHGFCDGIRDDPSYLPCSCYCHQRGDNRFVSNIPGKFHRRFYKNVQWQDEYGMEKGIVRTPATEEEAEVVSSEIGRGEHCPALDVDVPAYLVPSSTPGHSHLYIDVPMSWRKYKRLLKAMAAAGILEKSYVDASIRRRHTAVRVPWLKKGDKR